MTNKNLLQQLKDLREVKLSDDVKRANKGVLFSQISNTFVGDNKVYNTNLFNFKNVFSLMSQPLLVTAGIFLFLLGSFVLGSGLYENSKPNDSLYIARLISEKAKINTTFNQEQRDRLSAKFALDHARDINSMLMDPEFNTEENKDKVEKLNNTLRVEISKVKTRTDKNEEKINSNEEEVFVTAASSLKDDPQIDININIKDKATSTSDEKELEEGEAVELVESLNIKKDVYEEIDKLLDAGRHDEVHNKLNEIRIDSSDQR